MSAAKPSVVPLLMKWTDACTYLGISRGEFHRLLKAGEIPAGAMLPGQVRGQVWHRDQLADIADQWTGRARK